MPARPANPPHQPDEIPPSGRPTEEEVDMRDTVPQRTDKKGTKVEDQAGTGETDAPGG